jgi:hypothetical protein
MIDFSITKNIYRCNKYKSTRYLPIVTRSTILLIFYVYPLAAFTISLMLTAIDFDIKFNRFIIGLFFGLYGFSFIPGVEFDIVRHQDTYLHFQTHSSISDFLLTLLISLRPDFLMELVFLIIGKFFPNPQMVGFIGSFVFYYCFILAIDNCFIYIFPFKKTFFKYMVLFLMFTAVTVTYVFSGIRNGPASMLFLYLVTKRPDLAKIKNILLMFVPGMIHFSLFPVSLLYIISSKSSKKFIIILSLGIMILSPFVNIILINLYTIFSHYNGTRYLAAKINSYVLEGTSSSSYLGAGFRYYLVVLPLVFISPLFWFGINKYYKRINFSFHDYHKFIIVLFAYALFTIQTYVFSRLLLIFVYISIIYILYCLWTSYIHGKQLKQFMMLACLYVMLSIVPSWYMGHEYACINPVLLSGSLVDILSVKITPNDYLTNI